MKKLVEYIIRGIVEKPEKVKIEKKKEEGQISLKLSVASEDMGRVIGKGGKIIQAIRNIANIRAKKQGTKVYLELEED